eukprot:5822847-Pyramimonas_sp.AAC.1
MLALGALPAQIGLTPMPSLPKPEGDTRLIGLLSMVVRVWARCSREVVRLWEAEHFRRYTYGTLGKSCERAVWEQSFASENAALTERFATNSFLDLVEAYEK